jgi:hypothetical protein
MGHIHGIVKLLGCDDGANAIPPATRFNQHLGARQPASIAGFPPRRIFYGLSVRCATGKRPCCAGKSGDRIHIYLNSGMACLAFRQFDRKQRVPENFPPAPRWPMPPVRSTPGPQWITVPRAPVNRLMYLNKSHSLKPSPPELYLYK